MPELKKPIWGHTDVAGANNVYSYLHKGAARERRAKGIEGYLGRDSRALAEDLVNIWTRPGQTWAEAMDATRRADEKARGRARKRTFAHIILSPDPKDKITLEQLREFATAWAEEMFGYDDPAICPAQVAIVYHDDNARGIKHAHIVVNNLDLSEAGGSLQITKRQWFDATSRAQELAWERGMRGFDATRESVEPKKAGRARAKGRPARAERSETHTMAERKMGRGWSWKQNIREAIQLACNICDTPEEVIATLESAGIHCEPRRARGVAQGAEWIFYYPRPDVPNEENKKRVSSGRLGRKYTREGIEEQIQMSAYRRWAREDKRSEVIAAGLVDVFSVDPRVTLQELSDSMSAVNVLKVTNRREAQEKRDKLLAKLDRERELGRPTDRTEEHIRWLDAVIRTAAWVPDTWEDSITAKTRRRVDVEQGKREQRREVIPLEEKVARGYRLTKEEHSFLKSRKPSLFREWQANRRAAEHERKRAASSRSETATRQGTTARRADEQRSRNGESRSRSRGSDES